MCPASIIYTEQSSNPNAITSTSIVEIKLLNLPMAMAFLFKVSPITKIINPNMKSPIISLFYLFVFNLIQDKNVLFCNEIIYNNYSLIAPAVKPFIICFWKIKNIIIIGIADIDAPDIRCPQSIDCFPR